MPRRIGPKVLVPIDSEIDALEFVEEEELLWRVARRESRDPSPKTEEK